MGSQHNKYMSTSHFDIFLTNSNCLQIAPAMSLWVDIHVGLRFIIIWLRMNELIGVYIGKKSIINQEWVAWEGANWKTLEVGGTKRKSITFV